MGRPLGNSGAALPIYFSCPSLHTHYQDQRSLIFTVLFWNHSDIQWPLEVDKQMSEKALVFVLQDGVRQVSQQFFQLHYHSVICSCYCLGRLGIGLTGGAGPDDNLIQTIYPHSDAFINKRTNQKSLCCNCDF